MIIGTVTGVLMGDDNAWYVVVLLGRKESNVVFLVKKKWSKFIHI